VNLASLCIGLLSPLLLVREWVSSRVAMLGAAIAHSLSFPVLWYGTNSFVDPVVVGMVGVVAPAGLPSAWVLWP
jgi:hypothetical protein